VRGRVRAGPGYCGAKKWGPRGGEEKCYDSLDDLPVRRPHGANVIPLGRGRAYSGGAARRRPLLQKNPGRFYEDFRAGWVGWVFFSGSKRLQAVGWKMVKNYARRLYTIARDPQGGDNHFGGHNFLNCFGFFGGLHTAPGAQKLAHRSFKGPMPRGAPSSGKGVSGKDANCKGQGTPKALGHHGITTPTPQANIYVGRAGHAELFLWPFGGHVATFDQLIFQASTRGNLPGGRRVETGAAMGATPASLDNGSVWPPCFLVGPSRRGNAAHVARASSSPPTRPGRDRRSCAGHWKPQCLPGRVRGTFVT